MPLDNPALAITDPQLAHQAAGGDRQAFETLYQRHHQRVYALALRLCGNRHCAEDVTQASFIRAWHKLAQYRGDSQFGTWLHSLTVNVAMNHLKQQRSFWSRFRPLDDAETTHFAAAEHKPLEHKDLDTLLLRLPERARVVFVLCAIEGYQHDEVGRLLNIATGTSKAQYHRAKTLLKEMLS
ncbi:RNA polymerase sigma factor [Shewanella cyperi]|uniref:RNA polymerase sigma factor n=1 Tax=Shewanella cyperi TaxID=2814292 RepID=A0A974XNY2_9GAMM|nr:RNA polymerase sigma factor [Shewanella cyperi]QSX31915.1 RNA polymerase sigma factor [Shewanella cyperi]